MQAIVTDLHARLRAALPPEVPVLTPGQQREPYDYAPHDAQSRPMVGGGERGLGAYLAAHPAGYVQIEAPFPIQDGVITAYWTALAAVAPTSAAADALADQVRRVLIGTPGRAPGRYRPQFPPDSASLSPGAWLSRQTVQAALIGGQLI